MRQSNQVFRVFVSSTFDDLKAEREALQRNVFPELSDRCRSEGCRFQAIDMRWGISQEASLDQRTMDICLEEIRRCRAITPRPNFIVLLSERYGWCPLPAEIDAAAFCAASARVGDTRQRKLLTDWYRRDDNARPPVFCLRQRSGEFEDARVWERAVEEPLRKVLLDVAGQLGHEHEIKHLLASATEQEIRAGILDSKGAHEHTFCFFRNLAASPAGLDTSRFIEEDAVHRTQLDILKKRLRKRLGGNIFDYAVAWDNGEPSRDYLERLCEDVRDSLWRVIAREIESGQHRKPIEIEIANHRQFRRDRTQAFVGREAFLRKVKDALSENQGRPLAIYGESGCGKSALLGELSRRIRQTWYRNMLLVERYVGATADSVDIRRLLQGVLSEITGESDVGDADYPRLVREFHSVLNRANPARPLVILIDALDQLATFEHARDLAWLPATLPPDAYVIVSTTPGEALSALKAKLPEGALLSLEGMPAEESGLLLERWLGDAGRRLTADQEKVVRIAFEQCDLPLYFQLVFQEVRHWKSDRPPGKTRLKQDIPGIINDALDRMSRNDQHGRIMVSHSLSYLAAARHGLTEDELLDVLAADDIVFADIEQRSFHALPERRCPVVIWSRLYAELQPYLSQRSADGATVLSFFHRQLQDVVGQRFLPSDTIAERSALLARYFAPQRLERRGVSELPFAQARAGLFEDLERTLTDFDFIAAKIGYSGTQTLIDEYDLLGEIGDARRHWRRTLQRALRQSASTVDEEPWLLAGQLLGRVPAGDAPPLAALRQQARDWRGGTWLRPLLPSLGARGPLIRTLTHDGNISDIAVTRDGSRLVSASSDRSVRIWDARSGAELHRLEHQRAVVSVAISPDQHRILSCDGGSIRFWDIATGAEHHILDRPHMPTAYALGLSRDGNQVATITASGIRDWHLADGTFSDIRVQSMRWAALSADGRRIAIAQKSQVRFYDLDTGYHCRLKIAEGVDRTTISGDGKQVIVSARSGLLYAWRVDEPDVGPLALNVGLRAFHLTSNFDGSACLALHGKGMLYLTDLEIGKPIADFEVPNAHTAVMPDDASFALTVVGRRLLQLWDLDPSADERLSLPHDHSVSAVAIAPDARLALSGSTAGDIAVWRVDPARKAGSLMRHSAKVNALAFNATATRCVSVGADRRLLLWSDAEGSPTEFSIGAAAVRSVALTNDGVAVAVSGTKGGALRVWRFGQTADEVILAAHGKSLRDASISPDGRYVASAGGDRSVCRWDLAGEGCRTSDAGKRAVVNHIAIAADGMRTICGLRRSLRIAHPVSGETIAVLRGHTEPVRDVAMNANGERGVSVGRDGRLFLWNTENGTAIAVFRVDAPLTCCDISADGMTIVAGDELGRVHLLQMVAANAG